ncbi:hypothetical protein LR69_03599 [Geobacillus sp. BCO2]|nr:hypothetical protein LR69_03599 [Geobacillus sp. BCO2]
MAPACWIVAVDRHLVFLRHVSRRICQLVFCFTAFCRLDCMRFAVALYPLRRVAVSRTVPAKRYHAGEPIPVTVRMELPWAIPPAALTVSGQEPRHGGAMAAWPFRRRLSCAWPLSLPRGRHQLDIVRLEVSDALGFVNKAESFSAPCTIIVYPAIGLGRQKWCVNGSPMEKRPARLLTAAIWRWRPAPASTRPVTKCRGCIGRRQREGKS